MFPDSVATSIICEFRHPTQLQSAVHRRASNCAMPSSNATRAAPEHCRSRRLRRRYADRSAFDGRYCRMKLMLMVPMVMEVMAVMMETMAEAEREKRREEGEEAGAEVMMPPAVPAMMPEASTVHLLNQRRWLYLQRRAPEWSR